MVVAPGQKRRTLGDSQNELAARNLELTSIPRLFGTDGIRGPAGQAPLDAASLTRLGRALGKALSSEAPSAQAVLAGDTRSSTSQICTWLASGLEESGCATRYGGVLPTPAVARLTASANATVGIAVSASHNPSPDNGVKLLDGSGFKWPRDRELELERAFANEPALTVEEVRRREGLAAPEVEHELQARYLTELIEIFSGKTCEGLAVLLDTAHGAGTDLATKLFEKLGAEANAIGDRPDGFNINRDCGSTHPELAARETVARQADLGFAFDGDADRVVAIDETGALHDGDAMLYVLARWLHQRGKLDPPSLVATSMSNLGLEEALREAGIGLVRCDVGDRAVVETLRSEGLLLGGEQSGHIVHLGLSSTGDGLLTAALLARVVQSSGAPLSVLAAGFRRFPQILRNIRVASKPELVSLPGVMSEARRVEARLANQGRLVLRYSGTEPLARVMIEGRDQGEIEELADGLATTIASEIENLRENK